MLYVFPNMNIVSALSEKWLPQHTSTSAVYLDFPDEKLAKTGAYIAHFPLPKSAVHPDVPKAVSSLERPMPPCSETRSALTPWKMDINAWKTCDVTTGVLM